MCCLLHAPASAACTAHTLTPVPQGVREHSNFVNCVRFSPSGDYFVSVSNDMKGLIFDGKTGDRIGELNQDKASKHAGSIYSCCFAADSSRLATVSADKTVKVWAIPSGDLLGTCTVSDKPQVEDMQVCTGLKRWKTNPEPLANKP